MTVDFSVFRSVMKIKASPPNEAGNLFFDMIHRLSPDQATAAAVRAFEIQPGRLRANLMVREMERIDHSKSRRVHKAVVDALLRGGLRDPMSAGYHTGDLQHRGITTQHVLDSDSLLRFMAATSDMGTVLACFVEWCQVPDSERLAEPSTMAVLAKAVGMRNKTAAAAAAAALMLLPDVDQRHQQQARDKLREISEMSPPNWSYSLLDCPAPAVPVPKSWRDAQIELFSEDRTYDIGGKRSAGGYNRFLSVLLDCLVVKMASRLSQVTTDQLDLLILDLPPNPIAIAKVLCALDDPFAPRPGRFSRDRPHAAQHLQSTISPRAAIVAAQLLLRMFADSHSARVARLLDDEDHKFMQLPVTLATLTSLALEASEAIGEVNVSHRLHNYLENSGLVPLFELYPKSFYRTGTVCTEKISSCSPRIPRNYAHTDDCAECAVAPYRAKFRRRLRADSDEAEPQLSISTVLVGDFLEAIRFHRSHRRTLHMALAADWLSLISEMDDYFADSSVDTVVQTMASMSPDLETTLEEFMSSHASLFAQ